jgi:hypothetical protein
MAVCDHCGAILFGGVKNGDLRFCNADCASHAASLLASRRFPAAEIEQRVQSIHQAECPLCGGPGPVDIHTSHRVWSALVFTRWTSHPAISCRPCARKALLGSSAFSFFLGWWGFPWGLIMTPVQIGRNVVGLFGGPDPSTPSPALSNAVREMMVRKGQSPKTG